MQPKDHLNELSMLETARKDMQYGGTFNDAADITFLFVATD